MVVKFTSISSWENPEYEQSVTYTQSVILSTNSSLTATSSTRSTYSNAENTARERTIQFKHCPSYTYNENIQYHCM